MAGVMKRGKLITFEGIEGCGKSTQVELAAGWFASKQLRCFTTREPGGTDTGREIRKILLSEKTVSLVPLSEALLYLADRFNPYRRRELDHDLLDAAALLAVCSATIMALPALLEASPQLLAPHRPALWLAGLAATLSMIERVA